MVIQHGDFAYCPGILQLEDGLLLDTKDYYVLASNANLQKRSFQQS